LLLTHIKYLLRNQLIQSEKHKEDEYFFISMLTEAEFCGMIAMA